MRIQKLAEEVEALTPRKDLFVFEVSLAEKLFKVGQTGFYAHCLFIVFPLTKFNALLNSELSMKEEEGENIRPENETPALKSDESTLCVEKPVHLMQKGNLRVVQGIDGSLLEVVAQKRGLLELLDVAFPAALQDEFDLRGSVIEARVVVAENGEEPALVEDVRTVGDVQVEVAAGKQLACLVPLVGEQLELVIADLAVFAPIEDPGSARSTSGCLQCPSA